MSDRAREITNKMQRLQFDVGMKKREIEKWEQERDRIAAIISDRRARLQDLQVELEEALQKTKERVERKDQEITFLNRQIAAQRGQTTKLKNRIAKGVCPCCQRSFQNLKRHMESQHPDFSTGMEL